METIDDETPRGHRLHQAPTRFGHAVFRVDQHHPHALPTHAKPESLGQAGRWQSEYHDTMIDHDRHVGELLDCLDELGLAKDPSSSTPPITGRMNSWPDGATTPFRSEKATNWEGAFRVP